MGEIILDVRDVSIGIKDNMILSHINLSIEEGDFIFLKGSNGAGKTTFLNVLSCYNPNGYYRLEGDLIYRENNETKNIFSLIDTQWYKRKIYYIPQVQEDLGKTVFQKFADTIQTVRGDKFLKDEVLAFFDTYDIAGFIPNSNPKKLLDRNLSSLSEGQKKIIEIFAGIMRCIYIKILLLDEPLNHLDTGNIKKVINILSNLRQKNPRLAIILTTHCQAFPDPTKYLVIQSKTVSRSKTPYVHYDCFEE
jgi:ABC-type cobalamin/Fe3+-siderophores transport system ATPase subunit